MKILGILSIILLQITTIYAQDISEKDQKKHQEKVQKSLEKGKNIQSLDTLFASGTPYCIMKGMRKGIVGYVEYSVRPLKVPDNEEIYLVMEAVGTGENAVWYWNMAFVNQGQKIKFKNGTLDLENTIVDYDLFNDSALNIRGMNKLVLLKGGSPVSLPVVPAAASNNEDKVVERNRSAMIMIVGGKITQGGVHIGNVKKETSSGRAMIYEITVTDAKGALVAVAKNQGITNHEWAVITSKDNSAHAVTSSIGKDEDDVIKYLVDALYL